MRRLRPLSGGLQRLSKYLRVKNNSATALHDRLYVLWASTRIPELITAEERGSIIKSAIALQRPDGGWNLPSLGDWKRLDGSPTTRTRATAMEPVL
jgi:hypothetical protein